LPSLIGRIQPKSVFKLDTKNWSNLSVILGTIFSFRLLARWHIKS
jgi:hypothetical protein